MRSDFTEMFEHLEKIEWGKLEHAHGTAEHVPSAIRGLVSESAAERKESYWKLDNNVVLQSDLYESAFYVIPFLIKILKSESQLGREYVYSLLYEIANGSAPDDITIEHAGEQLPLTMACRKEIASHIEVYLSEIESESSNYRHDALELLCVLPEQKKYILSRLKQLTDDTKPEFSKNIDSAILELSE